MVYSEEGLSVVSLVTGQEVNVLLDKYLFDLNIIEQQRDTMPFLIKLRYRIPVYL